MKDETTALLHKLLGDRAKPAAPQPTKPAESRQSKVSHESHEFLHKRKIAQERFFFDPEARTK